MEIQEALQFVDRLQNLTGIYDSIEKAVCCTVHSYYDEMYQIEAKEADIVEQKGFRSASLDLLRINKRKVHNKYWSNKANFYQPCSTSSEPSHVWNSLVNIEVLQNGDDNNSLYIFKAQKQRDDGSLGVSVGFLLQLTDNQLFIEHEFFG
ncbi:hypothetical protein [Vibrio sp. 10N.261.55.A7]|uniref:hypothetical protein n=1 Tax=Vibrio sp. 10N.261.55.A7 TaxID=1880851 RepID=UPI000C83577A|nr:hypothetical protein [Vibrio sp. 10N.261.55.A7]PMJ92676.1 hypothetical protein BCU12_07390 [Vibrio sp. 10N.261.55.A7]